MSVNLFELYKYLNTVLKPEDIKDYCPNGLQVEGKTEINNLALAVTASLNVIEKAIERKADALLVHHGYFWRGENENLVGMKGKRIKRLMQNDISLLAYHLPLDVHSEFGNNVQLAKLLDIEVLGKFGNTRPKLGLHGEFKQEISLEQLAMLIQNKLGRKPEVIVGNNEPIKQVAFCTGAAQDFLSQTQELGVQAYISGEISERTFYEAKELGISYFACGHHATEKFGVQALGEHLADKFNLNSFFIDSGNIA